MIDYHVILRAVYGYKMKTLYKHVVGTPRSGAKKDMTRVSSDAKKGKKARNMIFFTSC